MCARKLAFFKYPLLNGGVWPLLRVLVKGVLRTIFGPRRDEVTGKWRKLHNEELNDLCSSPNIIRVFKSRRMRWTEHVEMHSGFWWET